MIDFSTIINITPSPFLSALTWIVLLISAMYFARRPFHRSMASFSRIIYNAMRLTATSVKLAVSGIKSSSELK